MCGDSIFCTAHAKLYFFFQFYYSKNSGRPQGKLVRRHKVLKSGHETKDEDGRGGDDESPEKFWHWKDLNVASDVDIFGRRFRLTNCNQWTRVNKKKKKKNDQKLK